MTDLKIKICPVCNSNRFQSVKRDLESVRGGSAFGAVYRQNLQLAAPDINNHLSPSHLDTDATGGQCPFARQKSWQPGLSLIFAFAKDNVCL